MSLSDVSDDGGFSVHCGFLEYVCLFMNRIPE